MPRRNVPKRRPVAEPVAPVAGWNRRETWAGEEWMVRSVTAAGALKIYRCPGCDQEIPPGVPHLVVWPDDPGSGTERRHWHSACWSARDRRRPTRRQ